LRDTTTPISIQRRSNGSSQLASGLFDITNRTSARHERVHAAEGTSLQHGIETPVKKLQPQDFTINATCAADEFQVRSHQTTGDSSNTVSGPPSRNRIKTSRAPTDINATSADDNTDNMDQITLDRGISSHRSQPSLSRVAEPQPQNFTLTTNKTSGANEAPSSIQDHRDGGICRITVRFQDLSRETAVSRLQALTNIRRDRGQRGHRVQHHTGQRCLILQSRLSRPAAQRKRRLGIERQMKRWTSRSETLKRERRTGVDGARLIGAKLINSNNIIKAE
jgi:hypothetical protein